MLQSNDPKRSVLTMAKTIVALVLACSFVPFGTTLKCYQSSCHKFSTGESLSCKQQIVTCTQPGYGRCMTIRATITVSNRVVYQEIRNCTLTVLCFMPKAVCDAGNKTGAVRKCEMGCCHGDFCNDGIGLVMIHAANPPGPSGSDLSCYSCSSVNRGKSTTNCSRPVKQTCGVSPMAGVMQDRCITLKIKSGAFEQEIRNCSDAIHCSGDNYCKSANKTFKGTLNHCSTSCCYGNLCNTDVTSVDSNVTSLVGTTSVTMETPSTRTPSLDIGSVKSHGSDGLSCYSCSTIPIPIPGLSMPKADCKNPAKQTCGMQQDRCVRLQVILAFGSLEGEIRNCSVASYCNQTAVCKSINQRGILTSCRVSCCHGNLCDTDAEPTTKSPPTSSSSAVPTSTRNVTVPSTNVTVPTLKSTKTAPTSTTTSDTVSGTTTFCLVLFARLLHGAAA